jgi:hypothetical protein
MGALSQCHPNRGKMIRSLEIREVYFYNDSGDAESYPLNTPVEDKLPEHQNPCKTWGLYGRDVNGVLVWLQDFTDLTKAQECQARKEKDMKKSGSELNII